MRKKMLGVLVIIIVTISLLGLVGYRLNLIPTNLFSSSATTRSQQNSSNIVPSFPVNSTPPTVPTDIIFDFDRGVPTLLEGQNIPFYQTSGGVTAYFNSSANPAAFSIQSYDTTFYTLSQFFGNYLFDNKITRDKLDISFSALITRITLTFATIEYHGPGHVDEPSFMRLTAFKDPTNTVIGSATAQGIISNNLFPQGRLSFDAEGKSFNHVRIEMLYQPLGGTDFLVDNIIVTTK